MAYQRAQWHSGLTYQQVCDTCKNTFRYTDRSLDFRPWFADGYIDCPVCKSHMRHSERFAIDAPQATVVNQPTARFCAKCGNAFGENDKFCGKCGAKRV